MSFEKELVGALKDPLARISALRVIERYRGMTVYIQCRPAQARRVLAARNMLSNGLASGEIARALAERFRITARTAYRDVNLARQMSKDIVINEA